MKELNEIQVGLIAPKNLNNSFGGYKYRSLESILEALKPLLKTTGCTVVFTDELVQLGERFYVRSTATLKNSKGEFEQSTAWAREQETKKGMDEAQVTGSASSYARKYAICSLLAIDDNTEPDMMDNSQEGQKPATKPSNSNKSTKKEKEVKPVAQTAAKKTLTQAVAKEIAVKLSDVAGADEWDKIIGAYDAEYSINSDQWNRITGLMANVKA